MNGWIYEHKYRTCSMRSELLDLVRVQYVYGTSYRLGMHACDGLVQICVPVLFLNERSEGLY